jgi:hypothetical protein
LIGKPEGGNRLEDPGVDGRILLKCIFEKCDGGVDWIIQVQYTNKWRAVVNAVTKLKVPLNVGNILTS